MKTIRDSLIVEDVEYIATNGFDEVEAKILRDAIIQIEKKRRAHFERTLKQAKKTVASWPEWKRNALGRLKD